MTRYTMKALREMVKNGVTVDITNGNEKIRKAVFDKEGYLKQIGYACGTYGCNGKLFVGNNTGKCYAITSRTPAIYIF